MKEDFLQYIWENTLFDSSGFLVFLFHNSDKFEF
jgi:hypothetical protein